MKETPTKGRIGTAVHNTKSALHRTKSRHPRAFLGAVYIALFLLSILTIWLFSMWDIHLRYYTATNLIVMFLFMMVVQQVAAFVLEHMHPGTHRARTLVSLSLSILRYVCAVIIIFWGMTLIGVNVETVVASMGIVALIVGFGAESLIADVVTGVFMLFENQYNVGDIVEVGGFRGTVCDIGIRTTSIVDLGGNVKIINNADMKNILNRSEQSSLAFCDIGIPYETDLAEFEKEFPALLEEIYSSHRAVFGTMPIYKGVQSLDDSAVVLRFTAAVKEKDIYDATRILNRDLFLGFRRLGVEVPYQQIDLHQK